MNEKIIRYFEGQMNRSELQDFEQQVNSSPSLKKEIEGCRKFLEELSSTKDLSVDENYFINILPRFRVKLESGKRKKYYPRLAFASALLTVIIIFYLMPDGKIVNSSNTANDLSTSEITDYLTTNSSQALLTNLPPDVETKYDSLLDNMIYNELNSDREDFSTASLYDKLDYNTIIQSIDRNEAAMVYEKLKNKKFF